MSQSKNSGVLVLLIIVILLILFIFPMFRLGLAHFGARVGFQGLPFDGFHVTPIIMMLPILVLTLLWILISVWVYNDAERNGMSGILWALLVFFGNFIALIIYLIVRSSSAGANPIVVPSATACPHCKGPIQPDFAVCPNCGTSLKHTCPTCKKQVQSAWKHCPYCGENL